MTALRPVAAALLLPAIVGTTTIAQQRPTLRTTTHGVRIDALVSEGSQPVVGLRAEDFEVLDKGVRQQVDSADAANHVAVALALDLSLNLRTEDRVGQFGRPDPMFPLSLKACEALLQAVGPGDRVALLAIADRVMPLVPLTSDLGALRRALAQTQAVPPRTTALFGDSRGGVTFAHETDGLMLQSSIWDATFAAASLVAEDAGRPLVVVVSDGIDDASWLSRADVSRTLADLGIAVDLIQPPKRRTHAGFATPEVLAKTTGGLLYKTDDSKLLAKLRDRLADLRQSYVLTYEPRGVGTNDGWHDVVVKVRGRNASVKARPGYYANRVK